MLPIEIPRTFLDSITISPTLRVPECVIACASLAGAFFIHGNEHDKLYWNDSDDFGLVCYAKIHQIPRDIIKAAHSIKKLTPKSFILTLNRKSEETLTGRGTYKKVKTAFLLTLDETNVLSIEPIICATDIGARKEPIPPNPFQALLENLPHVEWVHKHPYKTSWGLFKQFHIAKKAYCDAYYIDCIRPKPPNFYEICLILRDLTAGILSLFQLGLTHGDIKPNNLLIYIEKNKYSAKLCDTESVKPIGEAAQDQTWDYLSPLHRYTLIEKVLKTTTNPTTKDIADFYLETLDLGILLLSHESTLQSLGVVFADMLFRSKTRGTPEEMELIWATINDLIGFRPKPEVKTRITFNDQINLSLIEMANDKEPCPRPRISIEEVICRLESLTELGLIRESGQEHKECCM
jgi:hypothetical protein